ncbi:hypothetical protein N431DRAFT_427903 [Stipitochalara longipes BDJ]|nr:hypothetical protein N431DRAFT_427903 [Stipitochalara longipes BDJ]
MSSPKAPSKIHQTTLAILAAYEHQNLDEILSFRTEDCIHIIRPSSLPRPPMDNTAYRTFFSSTTSRIWNFKVTVSEIIEDSANNKVVVFASSTADSKEGVGSYGQEYVLLFEFEEGGEKIKRMVEWVDSVRAKEQVKMLFG